MPMESPILLKVDVGEAVRSLIEGNSPGVDNFSSELIKHGGKATTSAITVL
ncbi:hypothetical protein DPMN_125928 [Dreissena polymorpha]|uniref:Uncharacterized protein n=1 Tax=Dreissena polymorpha TaxID=45954 RepID=A0A9D4GYL8_DREPO|nr:hypothetical protein DPMN_125928 [Dreissena polymorpha]